MKPTSLRGIANKAASDKAPRFRNLFGLLSVEFLLWFKTADWIIDLGPEGGDRGGEVITTATPGQIAANEGSHTGRFLKPHLERGW
jgi:hypothetical protein